MRIVVNSIPSRPPLVGEEGKLYAVLPPIAAMETQGSCATGAENTGKKQRLLFFRPSLLPLARASLGMRPKPCLTSSPPKSHSCGWCRCHS